VLVTTAVEDLLLRHIEAGTVPGAVALLGSGEADVVAAGVASIDGRPMEADAIMRIQSMTKPVRLDVSDLTRVSTSGYQSWRTAGSSPAPMPRWTTRCRRTVRSPFATC
jgi:hypothetical protein